MSAASYSQLSRLGAWALLLFTLGPALLVAAGVLVAIVGVTLLQHFMAEGQEVWAPGRLIGLASVIVAPGLYLSAFYYAVASSRASWTREKRGWLISAVYHLMMVVIGVFVLQGRIESSHSLLAMPFWLLSAMACAASAWLFVGCGRAARASIPPALPPAMPHLAQP